MMKRRAILGTAALVALPIAAIAKIKGERYSSNENDPGYAPWRALMDQGRSVNAYVDGKYVIGSSTVDTGEGFVISATYDENGDIIYDHANDCFLETIHRGNVTVKIIERYPPYSIGYVERD